MHDRPMKALGRGRRMAVLIIVACSACRSGATGPKPTPVHVTNVLVKGGTGVAGDRRHAQKGVRPSVAWLIGRDRPRVAFGGRHLVERRVFWDGRTALGQHDKTFPDAGKVGVWTNADSVTEFDNLSATAL